MINLQKNARNDPKKGRQHIHAFVGGGEDDLKINQLLPVRYTEHSLPVSLSRPQNDLLCVSEGCMCVRVCV